MGIVNSFVYRFKIDWRDYLVLVARVVADVWRVCFGSDCFYFRHSLFKQQEPRAMGVMMKQLSIIETSIYVHLCNTRDVSCLTLADSLEIPSPAIELMLCKMSGLDLVRSTYDIHKGYVWNALDMDATQKCAPETRLN